MSYRTTDELSYYGSDFNKWIALNCTKKMIVNNIDCIMFKYSKNILRIIESKHSKEKSSNSQKLLLKMLARAGQTRDDNNNVVKIEVYMVVEDAPYKSVDILRINDNAVKFNVIDKDLIKFLDFEMNFNNL
jgi:hypothetical protein